MWNLITGKSSEKSKASPSERRRRKDNDQRSAPQPTESIVSSTTARKPSRGDDRDGDRGFNPTSTSYSSTSRSSFPGTASASIAASYATASSRQSDDAALPPGLVRNASLADRIPNSRPSRDDREHDRARERKSERRRSSSRNRKHDRDSKRRERKGDRVSMNRGDAMDRGLIRSGSGYAEEQNTSRAGELSAQASGSFNAQVGGSGFTQFPGQYDGAMPGFTSGAPPLHESMSAHVQDQFPGQFPLESAAPYRPPLAASEGGPGLAAEYYGDAGQSVAEQPGMRPHPQGPIVGAEPHLQSPSYTAAPPPEPSSAGVIGAAASFYSGVDFPPTLSSQPPMTGKPPKLGNGNKPSSSGNFSGSAALAGSAVLGSTAGITGEASYTQGSGGNSSAYYQHGSGRPPSLAEGTAGYSSTSAAINSSYHAPSAPVLPTLGAAAAGAAAGYLMGSHSSAQQQPSVISGHSGYSSPAMQRPPQFGDPAMANSANARPPRPAKYSSQSSTLPLYTSGHSNSMAQKHRHRAGPLGTFVEFWTDPDGVAQYEEYTEYIGVCKDCFAPGSSPRDAPRKHHYRRRRSDDRYGSSGRVDKESRWGSSDGENRKRNKKSWLAGGIAGYGLAEVGKTLFNQKRGADDTYSVHFSRGNASDTSLRRQTGSFSPIHGSRTSYGVIGGSVASTSRRRSRSRERVETGITSDGKIYRKDLHGSFVGGSAIKTYAPRPRSRSRSRSRSEAGHNGFDTAALGATIGSSVVASKSRHRSRSPERASVRSKHKSKERSPGRGEVSMLGGFFSSPSERRQRSRRKKKKGFFSFGNSSSSSADADLAFGAGLEVFRNMKQRSPRSRNDQSTDATFLGLSTAAAAIALRESQKKSKFPRKADLVAVKETKSKKSVSSERHDMGRRTTASLTTEEDLWESASEEDDSSSINTALAYGGPVRRSQDSLTSDSSGTEKWGWRWGSRKRSKRTLQVNPPASSFHIDAGAATATLAGVTAGLAGSSNMWQNESRMSSSSNLPPLQQVYPVPTSDPSRFDVTRHDSTASLNQSHTTSRPAPVPLQQPQPIFPVSHTVYANQPPYIHSYSAPSGPPVFSQLPYQSQPSTVGDPRDQSNGLTQPNVPGSFPGGDVVADSASWDGRREFSRRRRETSPTTRNAESKVDSLPLRRRASSRDESSAVHVDFPEEPKIEDIYDWRRREAGLYQGREEAKVQDVNGQKQIDHEHRSSDGVFVARTEVTSEPKGNMDRKGESQWHGSDEGSGKRRPSSRVVPVATRSVGVSISASAPEEGHFGAERHQEEHRKDSHRSRIENAEDPATNELRYPRERDPETSDNVEQHGQISRRVLSKSVKNPNHKNYADYFAPLELLSKSKDDRRSTNANGDNDVTSYQIPQIITVEPKGSGLSFLPAYGHTDEVVLDQMSVPWQVPRLNVIEPTPPHSIAGSTKGDTSPVIKPKDASLDDTEEILEPSTTPKVTWGKDEMHTYEVITPLEHLEGFIGTSRKVPTEEAGTRSSSEESPLDATPIIVERVPSKKLSNEEEDTHSSSEGSPLDATPIIVERVLSRKLSTEEEDLHSPSEARPSILTPIVDERVPRHMPGDFGDDLEFTATVAAGLEDTGFDPAIVVDDATFRRRNSPPGSEPTGSHRRPFAETATDLGLNSPRTGSAPPQRGFVEGELPPTPKYEQGPSANGNSSASKPGRKGGKSRQQTAQRETEEDGPAALGSTSELQDRGVFFDGPARYSTEPQPMVSVPVNVFDYLDEGQRADFSKDKHSERDVGELESTSSTSPVTTDLTRSEYFDAPEAAADISKPSRSQEFGDVTADLPATDKPVGHIREQKRTDKRMKKSNKSEQEGQKSGVALDSPGLPTLERNGESSPNRKSDRKSSRQDSERNGLKNRDSRLELSGPVSEEYREGKSKSRKSTDNSDLYDSPSEDTRPTPVFAPIEDEFDEPRKSKKKSKRSSSGYGDMSTSLSSSATLESKRESKSKSKKNKKGGILSLFGASKSSDKLSESAQDQDGIAEATSEISEEPRRKNKKSKEMRSTRDGDYDTNEASDKFMEGVPDSALPGLVDLEGTPADFQDANGKRKKTKDRRTSRAHNVDDGHSPANQTPSNLSQVEVEDHGGKSHQKEHKRQSQERDLVEESGRVSQALQAKDRDLPSTRNAPNAVSSDVGHANAGSVSDDPSSFLGGRPSTPPAPDIANPTSPHNVHAEKSVETFSPSTAQPETETDQIAGTDGDPFTPPVPVLPLEDLAPVPELEDHRRGISVVQVSENPQSSSMNSSPTAIPLHFRRPPASPGPARSSPFASPTTPSQNALVSVPPQRRSRPNSTEFKSSTEFRPLWLVERHGPRQDPTPMESYPSLPSSHTTSRSASVHDPEEIVSQWCHDDGSNQGLDESDGEDLGLRIDVSSSFEREDLLSSRQATPTAASFHLDTKDNVLVEATQGNGEARLSASHEDSAKEATRGVSASSPEGLSHNVGDISPARSVFPSIQSEALEALPPLPASGSSSPLVEDRVQETPAIPEEAGKPERPPFLPATSFSSQLHRSDGQETRLELEALDQLEKLPPLPASRSSSPIHESQGREASSVSDEAEPGEEVPPPSVSKSSTSLYEGQERELLSVSEEAGQPEQLPPLPTSRSSTPLYDDQSRGISTLSEAAGQSVDLPPLPSSRSSSPLREQTAQDTFSMPMMGALVGLAAATISLASTKHNKDIVSDSSAEIEATPPSIVHSTTGLSKDDTQQHITAETPDESEMLPTKELRKKDRKSRKASNSSYRDGLAVDDESVTQSINDQNNGDPVAEETHDIQEEDGQNGAEAWLTSSTSKKSKKDKKGKRKGRGPESTHQAIELLAPFKVEATSTEGSRAISPVDNLTLTHSPPPIEADIGTSSQPTEVVQDDWQGFVTNPKILKGKKGKKKHARSWQEETVMPGETGSDTALEGPRHGLEPQEAAPANGKDKYSPLSDADLGFTRVAGQSTNIVAPTLGSDAMEFDSLPVVNQKDEKTKEHLVSEDKRIPEPSPNLQQRLEITGQEPKSLSKKLDSVKDFEETTHAVSTPKGEPEEEFFTPMGIPQSTQEREAEAEFPFPTGRGKVSKKAKKKRKTLIFDDYVEPSGPVLRSEESPATRGLSEEVKAEQTGGFRGATSTIPNDTFELAVEQQGPIARSSDEKHSLNAVSPTLQGSSSVALAPETTPLPIDDDVDLIEPAPANPTDPVLGPESVPLPVDEDFDLIEKPHASAIDRSLTPEVVPLPRDSNLDLISAPKASLADRFLTPQALPLLIDDEPGLAEASRASPAEELLSPEAVPLPIDGDLELIEAPLAAERTLTPEAVPLPRDRGLDLIETRPTSPAKSLLAPEAVPLPPEEDLDLTEAPQASPRGRMLTPEDVPLPTDKVPDQTEVPGASTAGPEAVPLPTDEDHELIEAISTTERMQSPAIISLLRGNDLDLVEAPPAVLIEQALIPGAFLLPKDENPSLIAPRAGSIDKRLGPEAIPLPAAEDLDLMIASPAILADQSLAPEAVPLPIDEDLSLNAPRAGSADKRLTPETIPLPQAEDLDLIAPRAGSFDKWSTPKATPRPADDDLPLIAPRTGAAEKWSPPKTSRAISAGQSLIPEAVSLPTDKDLDLNEAPPANLIDTLLTPEAMPMPIDKDPYAGEPPPRSSTEQTLSPDAVPLPIDDDLDLLEALPASPIQQFSDVSLQEFGTGSAYGPKVTAEEDPALTLSPPASGDGPDQLVLGRALGERALVDDALSAELAIARPMSELGDMKQDSSSVLARVVKAVPLVHDSSPSSNVTCGLNQSPIQEAPEAFFSVVPKKKSKKGKKSDQSFSVIPDLGPASVEPDSPVVATETDSSPVDRAVSVEASQEPIDEGEWDMPSKKKKSRKGKKEKSAVREPVYASQEAVVGTAFVSTRPVPIEDVQSSGSVKDITNSAGLGENPSLHDSGEKEASASWDPFQKKPKKGKKSKTLKQQSLSRDPTLAVGKTEESPVVSESSLATTDTSNTVREILADRGSTPDLKALPQQTDALDPSLSDPKAEQTILERPSNYEDTLIKDSTNEERSMERETEVSLPIMSIPDNLLAAKGKFASTSTAMEVQEMLADRGGPRPSDDISRGDVFPSTAQSLTKPQQDDDETWDIPVKKKGQKGKKDRPLQGHEYTTDESSIPPTPAVEPETTPSNEDAVVAAAENFALKKSKKDKKGKKKTLRQASTNLQDEAEAEAGVMPEIDNDLGKETTHESYFDQTVRPTEFQELPLSPHTHNEDLLEYAASVPLPLDEVNDKPAEFVVVQRVQESEEAWSEAVEIAEAETAPVESLRSQQLSKSSPDPQEIIGRSSEDSVVQTPNATANKTAPMTENTRDYAVEDDFTTFPTEKMGKKAKRQQKKQVEHGVDDPEDVPLPASIQPKKPAMEDETGSSLPVDKTALGGRFSPEMGAASRNALRELELEDGVSYFGLTSTETGNDDEGQDQYSSTVHAGEENEGAVYDGHTMNNDLGHGFLIAPHEGTLATIVEQPDAVDPVALGHEPDSQLADQGQPNQENPLQLLESTSKDTERNIVVMEPNTGSSPFEQNDRIRSYIDDAPVQETTPLLARTDFPTVHHPDDSLAVDSPAGRSSAKSVASQESVASPSSEDFSPFTTSRKSKKGKKSKRKQEFIDWENETASPAAVDTREPTVEIHEASLSPATFEAPELGTSHNDKEYLPAEQPEHEPSVEASLPPPTKYHDLGDLPTLGEAENEWANSTKKSKKKGKKLKQQAEFAQSIDYQPQLEKTGESDASASQEIQFQGEPRNSYEFDISREPQESRATDTHTLVQHPDPVLMAKDDEHTSLSAIEPYHQIESTIQDSLPSSVPQISTSRADIDERAQGLQAEHEHTTTEHDPQEVTAINEGKHDELWTFPPTKKSKKPKKQSTRLDPNTYPQDMQPEPSGNQPQQYRSTGFDDLPQYTGTPEESRSASPPQVRGHRGDGQLTGVATLATIGAGIAGALWQHSSVEKSDNASSQRDDRQRKAYHNERVESPSLHVEAQQPREGSLQLDNATQERVPAQSQLYDESQSSNPQHPAEDEHRQNIMRPPVPSFHYEDDTKRDSAVQISDSPLISERIPTYDVVRDSGYQGTESSPPIGTDPDFMDTSGVEHRPEAIERLYKQARHEEIATPGQVRGYNDSAILNAANPLNISIEVDPAYEAAIPGSQLRRGRGRVRSNPQDDSFDNVVSPRTNLRRAEDVGFPVQHLNESPQPSPVDSTSKDRSSILFQSSPSTREQHMDQPVQHGTLHDSHDYEDRTGVSPAYNDSTRNISEPEMPPRIVTHDGAAILAARASSLAALSGITAVHHGSPRSLFGGPVGVNSDLPSIISPPRTPFSLENAGRRQLNTITEYSPEELSHHNNARAISDIGSPERATKSARRSMTPGEISQRRIRSPTTTATGDKSLISTDDVLARLSWPPVDEDNHSVDLERSRSRNTDRRPSSRPSNVSALMSDAVKQRETEYRSLSGASIRSGESINAIIRTPEQFRSASGLSNRSGTPPLRRADTRSISGDLRAASKLGEAKNLAKPAKSEAEPVPAPAPALPLSLATPSSSTYDPVKDKGKSRVRDMADVYEGWGDVHNNGSPLSPTRPPSMRRRQSMQLIDLESRVDQLVSENRLLQDAKSRAERGLEDAQHDHVQKSSAFEGAIGTRDAYLRQKDSELDELRRMLQSLQNEVTRLTEVNQSLETSREVDGEYAQRYSHLQAEHSDTHGQWQQSRRELEDLRSQHSQLSTGMEGIVRHEVSIALEGKNAELARLRQELEEAKEQVRTLQRQILASKPSDNFLIDRDEDYFDTQCQQLCQRVQQWVLRFSKLSDMKACRLMGDIDDEKVLDRLDNAILDGSDVDNFLVDRVKRRDVFMAMVMTMIWEYIFTRYLFGMDREQRQKLKALEKTLAEVGPMSAVHKWRATTLMLLSKREVFVAQRSQDSEAVVQEIYGTLSMFLPPPAHLETQIQESLRHVMKAAIDLSIEMRTQRAEYVMLPPLQPEYNTNGDLARKVYFNASMMNERSGDISSNEELEAQRAVVRMVLFPLVVKKDDASGDEEQIVVCPAQVLVAKPGKDKKVVRVMSGERMDVDRNRSVQSFAPSSMDMGMGNMI